MSEDMEPKEPQSAPKTAGKQKFDFNKMVFDLWNGKLPLVQVFWLYYFAPVIVLAALGSVLGPMAKIFELFQLVWAGFMVKPIWVAADDFKGPQHWAWIAKIASVLIGIAVVGRLLNF